MVKLFNSKKTFVILLMFFALSSYSQQYLYIKKKGELPKERIGVNDNIKFKINGREEWISGMLKEITATAIKVNDRLFYFSNIESIQTQSQLLKTLGTSMWVGGAFFSSIAAVNSIINDERPILSNNQIILGSGLGAIGYLVGRLALKTYSREKGYNFEVIDLDQ